MEIELNLLTLSHLSAITLGLASGLVLFYFSFKNNRTLVPLALGQISLSAAIFINLSILTQLLVYYPFMYRLGNFFAWIFVPMPLLYLHYHLQNRNFKWLDLAHFIPVVVYVVDFAPVLLLSNEAKLDLILQEIHDPALFARYNQSRFFPPDFHQIVRALAVNAYWIAQVWVVIKWMRSMTRYSLREKIWLRWMLIMLVLQFFLFFPFYLSMIWGNPTLSFHLVNSIGALMLLASSLMVFFYPNTLYYRVLPGKKEPDYLAMKEKAQAKGSIPDILKNPELAKTMEEKLVENNRFLNIRYSIHDFSNDIGLPAYLISQYLNQHLQMSFIDFVNKKRIEHCVEQMKSGRLLAFSMDAVARECGFNNRNSFTMAFQKFRGTSPSEFRKTQIRPD
jgi:AraC-like DNA-binding protein